jgi:hypothetical protein
MNEIWKPVVGAEQFYHISNFGRLKSLHERGRPTKGGIVALQPNKKGYLRAELTVGGRRFTRVVHRLVLEAFIGPQPSAIHEANHKDGIKNHNIPENLEWVTPVENNAHSVINGFWKPHKGEAHGMAKLTAAKAKEIYAGAGQWTASELAKRFGVTPAAIRLIWRGINWKHVTQNH